MYLFHKKTKVLRGFALVCVLALGLCLTGGLQIAEAKTTTYYDASAGRLHVKGTKLVDKKGHEVQLRGVSTHGLSWYPQYVNDKCFAQLHDKWGANVVRLAMYTEEYNGYCSGDAKNRSDLKKLIKKGVRLAKKHKMYVIVDWHILSDGNPNSHKKEAKAFFREMSREFKGYNNVIYEICNEPNNGTSWKEIKSYARSVISTIRKNDKKAVIVVGTPTWSQDVDQAAADPIKGDNIMYALHFYAATHKTDLRNKMTAAINKGLPVFVTEYGICDASGNGAIDKKEADRWIKTMDEYGVSYIAWNLSNKQESSSIIKSSCPKVSGFKKSELSDEGRWLYHLLRKKAGLTK
ncbi:MAG TPA: glycosyl hydrolase family 5 [Roseburia sp.]|nr:glycosyl hydrolase family 5 [Roseburia sp.]